VIRLDSGVGLSCILEFGCPNYKVLCFAHESSSGPKNARQLRVWKVWQFLKYENHRPEDSFQEWAGWPSGLS
jgi:hypothetical protein